MSFDISCQVLFLLSVKNRKKVHIHLATLFV